MLLGKIQKTSSLISEVKLKRVQQALYSEYADFLTKLKEDEKEYLSFLASFNLLYEHNTSKFQYFDLSEPIKRLTQLLTVLEKGDEVLKRGRLVPITDQIKQYEIELNKQWKQYVIVCSSELMETLGNMKGIMDDPTKLTLVVNDLDDLQKSWPITQGHLIQLQQALKEAEGIITELKVAENIQIFLKLVTAKKAKLSDITPEIIQWLKENNLARNLELSFVSSSRR